MPKAGEDPFTARTTGAFYFMLPSIIYPDQIPLQTGIVQLPKTHIRDIFLAFLPRASSMAFNLRPSQNSIPTPTSSTQVKMLMPGAEQKPSTPVNPADTLWTVDMTDCHAIATLDHDTNVRTLIHIRAGRAHRRYFEWIADRISPKTTIIIVAGGWWSQDSIQSIYGDPQNTYRVGLETAMTNIGKATDDLQWEVFWGNGIVGNGDNTLPLGFSIQADGLYGPIDQADGGKCCTLS